MTNPQYDVIVIGGGVNGLTCAAMLGKAGRRTVLVEQHDHVGGCATDHELAPGFRVPTLAHRTGPLRQDVVEGLQLVQHGLRLRDGSVRVSALLPEGAAISIHADHARTAAALAAHSARDAQTWPSFQATMARLANVVGTLYARTPPDVDKPEGQDLWTLTRTVRAFRGLPRNDAWRLLRWGPMAVADLVSEVFESDVLQATVAADGLLGGMFGPWSAGSGLQLLLHEANRAVGIDAAAHPASVARALETAARRHGVAIETGARVSSIEIAEERAVGVRLANGDTRTARAIVSGLDPKRTFTTLCDADYLPPEFLWRISHIRSRGTLAKVNLALSALPTVSGVATDALASPVRIGPSLEYLERAYDCAKYGRLSDEPWMEFTIPSVSDPTLAPAGAHVLSAYVQFAPYELRPESGPDGRHAPAGWDDHRDALGDIALDTLERYIPGIRALVLERQVITPLDLERNWGLTGGHIFHGELSLDQAFTMRPLLGWGRYRTPIAGLYLCGSGTHPGTGLTGGSGANAAREILRD
jgi:phytoene dehydrogenase-like protein